LHVCGNNPDCIGFRVEEGEYRIKGYEGPVIECDKCGADMQLKSGRFGKYFGCTSAGCKNTRKLLRSGEAAPPKSNPVPMPELRCAKVDDYYVLRDGAAGIFLAASQFPKHRETRAPTIAELKRHRAEIDAKHHYLLDAPETDRDGHPAVVKYSRKSRAQFVASEVSGKPTGWRAVYRDGQWVDAADELEAPDEKRAKPTRAPGRRAPRGRVKRAPASG
jgi:DNA topoisomerase-1